MTEPSFPGCFGRTVARTPHVLSTFGFIPLRYQAISHLLPCADVCFGHHRCLLLCVPAPAPKALTHCPLPLWQSPRSHLDEAPGPARSLTTALVLLHAWGWGGGFCQVSPPLPPPRLSELTRFCNSDRMASNLTLETDL